LSQPAVPGLARPIRPILIIALSAYLAIGAWLVWRTAILEPYSDMFDWLERWRDFQADGKLGHYLWAPHNFHHLVWIFTVLDLDIRAFGGSGYLFLAVGVLCLAATAAMLAWASAEAAGDGLRLVGAGGAALLALMGCHVLDATAAINTTYVHALVFAVAAILLAEGPGDRHAVRRTAALACAIASGLGSAAGLAVWPALLLAAWREGRRGWTLAVLMTGVAFGFLYLLGQDKPADAGFGAGGRVTAAVLLFINYVGLPWVRGVPPLGWVVGLVVLSLALTALAVKGKPGAAWPERAAIPLILFSLATAVMTGIGRTGAMAPSQVPMRYAVFMIPLHVGLWILALPYLRRAWARRPRTTEGAVVAAVAIMLVHQVVMGVYAVRTADMNQRIIDDFHAGKRTPEMLITIYTKLDKAQAMSEQLRREGRYQRELRSRRAPPTP
jgi:hypothetical protein